MPAAGKGKIFVPEITRDDDHGRRENVGVYGIHPKGFRKQSQQNHADDSASAVDEVTAEILAQPMPLRAEDEEFITEKGVGDGGDVDRNGEEKIVDPIFEQTISQRIKSDAEKRVPSPDRQISQYFVLPGGQPVQRGDFRKVDHEPVPSHTLSFRAAESRIASAREVETVSPSSLSARSTEGT